ncbi:PREDICTED: scarecrow-like protein 14 [Fragaria vesca subsp. vesca]|uniref:scarecrow-like protein 14 n=1 Tax=Fragaria vesca subsp. vesca TaxID=101020 RepID=UPI0002C31763|nr:PREDICTED: scarecrow-like protein 14 [Fragaria vesca subsp. vesca]
MDSPFSEYPNFNDQTLLLDMLNEYPSVDLFDDLSFLDPNPMNSALSSSFSPVGDDGEFSNTVHINRVLMEEDMEPTPCLFPDPLVLQPTEESLYEITGAGKCSTSLDQNPLWVDQNEYGNGNGMVGSYRSELMVPDEVSTKELLVQFDRGAEDGSKFLPRGQLITAEGNKPYTVANSKAGNVVVRTQKNGSEHVRVGSRGKNSHLREEIELEDGRNNKQSVVYVDDEEGELSDSIGKALLSGKAVESKEDQVCQNGANNGLQQDVLVSQKACGMKRGNKKEVIDLRRLLISCAEAVAVDDRGTASELLKQIRQHSSPFGDYTQRLSHCFANALEARLAGTGSELYTTLATKRASAAAISKFYRAHIAVCPFMKMWMIFANQMIIKAAEKAETLHIIDFGIRQGFQWPALIHCLSRRPGGPPKLRITGLELTLSGCHPEETVQETGHRLANYCKRFNVPFEYHAIAKKWETVQLDEFKVQRNEVLAVNCLCRFKYLLDETVMVNSPRDTVLNIIRKLNPDIFVQSVINGSHDAPFFVPRFREALYHFSALFDVLDTTLPREDQVRLGFEKEFIGREVLNIVACEGIKRIARPETYKQWQIRNMRAGFRLLPLDYEVVNKIKDKVKMEYHPNFVVNEDGHWMLHGWKGRMMFGSACWAPSTT